VMSPRFWGAMSKPGKDAGSPNTKRIGTTEDAAWRRSARSRSPVDIAGRRV
jgi:hypothetical protein